MAATGVRTLGQAPDLTIPWARIVLGLLFCVVLAVLAVLAIRQRQGLSSSLTDLKAALFRQVAADASQGLTVEQRLRLSPASQVIILRCGERRYLLHISPQGAQMLDQLADARVPSDGPA